MTSHSVCDLGDLSRLLRNINPGVQIGWLTLKLTRFVAMLQGYETVVAAIRDSSRRDFI